MLTVSWFVVGQLMAPVALQRLNKTHPFDFRVAIYTQWGMLGLLAFIFFFIPESPCELTNRPTALLIIKGGWYQRANLNKHRRFSHLTMDPLPTMTLQTKLSVFPNQQHTANKQAIMLATIEEERRSAIENSEVGFWTIFKGTNGWRLLIAAWPKIAQQVSCCPRFRRVAESLRLFRSVAHTYQFVGLAVFNTYATYFFQLAGAKDPFCE